MADAMTNDGAAHSVNASSGTIWIAVAFVALLALTSAELIVVGLDAGRAARITALAGLLMAKVGVVMAFFMHARANRRAYVCSRRSLPASGRHRLRHHRVDHRTVL